MQAADVNEATAGQVRAATGAGGRGAAVRITAYDAERHGWFLRRCIAELQDAERGLDPRLPSGHVMAGAYERLLLERCRTWDGFVAVAEVDDRPAGLVAAFLRVPSTEPDEPPGHYALVSDLVVLPAYRRRGIGDALVRHVEERARAAGAPVLRLEVMAGNYPAHTLYARLGYRPRVLQLEKPLSPAR